MVATQVKASGPQGKEREKNGAAFKVALIALIMAFVAGGGAYFGYTRGLFKDIPGGPASQTDHRVLGPVYSPDAFIVNVAGTNGERYLKVSLSLELSNKRAEAEVRRKAVQVRDLILDRLSRQTLGDLQSEDGKAALRRAIAQDINEILDEGKVKSVYFTEFVLQ